jgi:4-hydroxyproline epimerase
MAINKTFECIDAHTCGNPVRVVKSGGPELIGANMQEKRLHFLQEYDWVRLGLMFEPRGHDLMSGSILYPPSDSQNDAGVLFIETSGCLPMCGHGTIGTVTVAIEHGLINPKTPGKLMLETPAGVVPVTYSLENGKVKSVKMVNVPSFVAITDLEIDSPDLGKLKVSISYGGNFYAIIETQDNFSDMDDYTAAQLISMSGPLRKAINKVAEFVHPEDKNINGCSHIMWTGKPKNHDSDGRNAVFYGDKAIDRSPCGTGTSARMALLVSRGELQVGDSYVSESIIGSQFIGTVEQRVKIVDKEGIIPSIEGWAKITGTNIITIDEEDDPHAFGFQVI